MYIDSWETTKKHTHLHTKTNRHAYTQIETQTAKKRFNQVDIYTQIYTYTHKRNKQSLLEIMVRFQRKLHKPYIKHIHTAIHIESSWIITSNFKHIFINTLTPRILKQKQALINLHIDSKTHTQTQT